MQYQCSSPTETRPAERRDLDDSSEDIVAVGIKHLSCNVRTTQNPADLKGTSEEWARCPAGAEVEFWPTLRTNAAGTSPLGPPQHSSQHVATHPKSGAARASPGLVLPRPARSISGRKRSCTCQRTSSTRLKMVCDGLHSGIHGPPLHNQAHRPAWGLQSSHCSDWSVTVHRHDCSTDPLA